MNERFTAIADAVTAAVGQWWFTVLSFFLLLAWILYGAFVIAPHTLDWFTSTDWNFPLNTITTVGEWFMEGLVLAAANRVERHNRMLLESIHALAKHSVHEIDLVEVEVQHLPHGDTHAS